MERKTTLFEYVYGDLVREITGGALRPGDTLPSMGELGKRYRVGARTVRDVLKALKDDGYIATEERRRATVAFRSSDDDVERAARSLLARRDELLACYRTLELVMPPLYAFAARHCRADELAALGRALERADVENRSGDWRLSRSSLVLHELLDKAGNPLFSECYAGLERASAVPALPGFADPYVRATEESDNLLGWMFASLSGDDPAEVQRRFGLLYRGTAEYVERYLDELDAAYPGTEGEAAGSPGTRAPAAPTCMRRWRATWWSASRWESSPTARSCPPSRAWRSPTAPPPPPSRRRSAC
ncbi:FadR/GntR family transcriptional regulator [Gordonibacter pamelaeae]|uniref:FadR/GntR family transcriptional regulator n=1 Tax=Gordonibacter pamelaeae TaxID=471189 RepID=UPI003A944024